jgi:hypothetical protein
MAALARVFRIDEIEEDPSLVEGATKLCFDCDPDNPKSGDRATCKTCNGTGQQALAAAEIAKELKASKRRPTSEHADEDFYPNGGRGHRDGAKAHTRKIKAVDEDDLFLEY